MRTVPSPDTHNTAAIYRGKVLFHVAVATHGLVQSPPPGVEAPASMPLALIGTQRRNFSATVHTRRASALAGRSIPVAFLATRRRTSESSPRPGRRCLETALAPF